MKGFVYSSSATWRFWRSCVGGGGVSPSICHFRPRRALWGVYSQHYGRVSAHPGLLLVREYPRTAVDQKVRKLDRNKWTASKNTAPRTNVNVPARTSLLHDVLIQHIMAGLRNPQNSFISPYHIRSSVLKIKRWQFEEGVCSRTGDAKVETRSNHCSAQQPSQCFVTNGFRLVWCMMSRG